ncbi:MAG: hypothetical protein JNK74_27970 [Candidatus Hydrogenedentes bacterium]|nr:hypothetical protein [Candidatus Hydrogenedentota bacterium]
MDEGQEHIAELLEEMNTQLRHIKWILLAGLAVMSILLLTVIALIFMPMAGLALAAFLIITPTAYLYYIFVSNAQQREARLRRPAKKKPDPLLTTEVTQ